MKNYRAQATIKDKFGDTAMHFAARNGHIDVCKFLI